jgi:hypothetical protein
MPSSELVIPKYCESVYQTKRRPTRTVHVSLLPCARLRLYSWPAAAHKRVLWLQIGKVKVGSQHRIALQTMTTTDTRNVQATVDQVHPPAPARASSPGAPAAPQTHRSRRQSACQTSPASAQPGAASRGGRERGDAAALHGARCRPRPAG